MRSFLTLSLMILSVAAFSFTDESKEQGRECFQEIKALGCGNPREDRGAFKKCVSEKAGELSESCQSFHQKMKDRPRHHKRGPWPERESTKTDA